MLEARDTLAVVDTDALGDDVGAYLTNALEALDSLILRSDALRILVAAHRPLDDSRDTGDPVTDSSGEEPRLLGPDEKRPAAMYPVSTPRLSAPLADHGLVEYTRN